MANLIRTKVLVHNQLNDIIGVLLKEEYDVIEKQISFWNIVSSGLTKDILCWGLPTQRHI